MSDVAPIPASAPSGHISAPVPNDVETLRGIRNLYLKLNPEEEALPAGFNQQMDAALKGGLTIDEAAKLLGLRDLSNAYWQAFCGGQKIETREDLLNAMQNAYTTVRVTGTAFYILARSDNIIAVDRKDLGKMMRAMGLDKDKNALANNSVLKEVRQLAMSLGGEREDKGDFNGLKDTTWELMGFALFYKYTFSVIRRKMGYEAINKLDLSNAWVRDRFSGIFTNYAKTADPPSKQDLDDLLWFQGTVKAFKDWTVRQGIPPKQADTELSPAGVKTILDGYKTEGKAWVLQQLNDPQNKKGRPASVPVVESAPPPAAPPSALPPPVKPTAIPAMDDPAGLSTLLFKGFDLTGRMV